MSDLPDHYHNDITPISEPSELKGAISSLMEDTLDEKTSMSSIDMRARLSAHEINAINRIDTLVAMDALPTESLFFTRQKKRLSVSWLGLGRKEIVSLAQAELDKDGSKTLGQSIMGMFGCGRQ